MSYCDACAYLEKPANIPPCSGCHGGDAFSMRADLVETRDKIAKLTSDLAEADRRAGAAERMLESEKDTTFRRRQWTREAKEAWGTDDRESFDKVWEEALGLKYKFEEYVASEVSSRIKSVLSCASMGIPLAKDTLEHVAVDADASPELRSDAVRAIDGLLRIENMAAHATKGPKA